MVIPTYMIYHAVWVGTDFFLYPFLATLELTNKQANIKVILMLLTTHFYK